MPSRFPRAEKPSPALTRKEVKHWDADFLKVDQATLFDLIMAANYLNIQSLLDQCVADMIKGHLSDAWTQALKGSLCTSQNLWEKIHFPRSYFGYGLYSGPSLLKSF
ncbi:hypothetical protein L7F22_033924 [Adiantum nelumboides]|nr:hypothetical protein [Adiantum nelumboides]